MHKGADTRFYETLAELTEAFIRAEGLQVEKAGSAGGVPMDEAGDPAARPH
jgi:hypothetical protein